MGDMIDGVGLYGNDSQRSIVFYHLPDFVRIVGLVRHDGERIIWPIQKGGCGLGIMHISARDLHTQWHSVLVYGRMNLT